MSDTNKVSPNTILEAYEYRCKDFPGFILMIPLVGAQEAYTQTEAKLTEALCLISIHSISPC